MEGNALTQLEFPCQIVDRLPGDSQIRLQPLGFILGHQPAEDILRHGVVRAEVMVMRVN